MPPVIFLSLITDSPRVLCKSYLIRPQIGWIYAYPDSKMSFIGYLSHEVRTTPIKLHWFRLSCTANYSAMRCTVLCMYGQICAAHTLLIAHTELHMHAGCHLVGREMCFWFPSISNIPIETPTGQASLCTQPHKSARKYKKHWTTVGDPTRGKT